MKEGISVRTIFIMTLMSAFFATLPAYADVRGDVMAGSVRCAGIIDDRVWLDCYYGAAQPMRAKLGLPPAPNSQQNLVPGPQLGTSTPRISTTTRPAGLLDRVISFVAPEEQKPEPATRMTSFKFDAAGYFTVVLANGETWRQSQGDAFHARWRNKPEKYVVSILPGDTGSGKKMKVADDQVYKVEQVKSRP